MGGKRKVVMLYFVCALFGLSCKCQFNQMIILCIYLLIPLLLNLPPLLIPLPGKLESATGRSVVGRAVRFSGWRDRGRLPSPLQSLNDTVEPVWVSGSLGLGGGALLG